MPLPTYKQLPHAKRDWQKAVDRTQLYIRMLLRKKGATADQLAEAARQAAFATRGANRKWANSKEAPTHHNRWSLEGFADVYGFECWAVRDWNAKTQSNSGPMRYQFVPKGAGMKACTAFDFDSLPERVANENKKPERKKVAASRGPRAQRKVANEPSDKSGSEA